jgi:hypothetical protein
MTAPVLWILDRLPLFISSVFGGLLGAWLFGIYKYQRENEMEHDNHSEHHESRIG